MTSGWSNLTGLMDKCLEAANGRLFACPDCGEDHEFGDLKVIVAGGFDFACPKCGAHITTADEIIRGDEILWMGK